MTVRPRVLVIEDDHEVAGGIVRGLRAAGFDVELCVDGTSGRREALRGEHDALVLDLMLPGLDGLAVLEAVRAKSGMPVIVVSARSELDSRLRVFERGAVDFVPKPFWIDELVARLRARLGASAAPPARRVEIEDLEVDLDARTVGRAGEPIALTRSEFDVLAFLVERPDRAISRRELARVLGVGEDQRTIDSHVARTRRKLGPHGERIETVWGIGYRFRGTS